jgi:hypothetical protein
VPATLFFIENEGQQFGDIFNFHMWASVASTWVEVGAQNLTFSNFHGLLLLCVFTARQLICVSCLFNFFLLAPVFTFLVFIHCRIDLEHIYLIISKSLASNH